MHALVLLSVGALMMALAGSAHAQAALSQDGVPAPTVVQPSLTQPHGAARQIYQPRSLAAPALIIPSPSYATSYGPQVATAPTAPTARMHDCTLIQRVWYCHSYNN
jgi:hypothetical protein